MRPHFLHRKKWGQKWPHFLQRSRPTFCSTPGPLFSMAQRSRHGLKLHQKEGLGALSSFLTVLKLGEARKGLKNDILKISPGLRPGPQKTSPRRATSALHTNMRPTTPCHNASLVPSCPEPPIFKYVAPFSTPPFSVSKKWDPPFLRTGGREGLYKRRGAPALGGTFSRQ